MYFAPNLNSLSNAYDLLKPIWNPKFAMQEIHLSMILI